MATILKTITFILLLCFCTPPAVAQPMAASSFDAWLQILEQEAVDGGVAPAIVHAALDQVTVDDRVIALDEKQPETTVSFETYIDRLLSDAFIAEGRQALQYNRVILNAIAQRYGVPPQVIVALWGIESHFGRNSGKYQTVDSLVTLAYAGRRADFFRNELISALSILDQEHMPSSALRGSWAGAMGQCQFMPSTYLRYAVDYTGDGTRDIWQNKTDVFASIANYLAAEGWNRDLTWGREVMLAEPISDEDVGLTVQKSLQEWRRKGVMNLNGSSLPDENLQASLIRPDGQDGRSFLIYDNFRALMRWNHSTYFATAVGLMADRMR